MTPSIRIHQEDKDGLYFLTLTIQHWYYLFDRHGRFRILEDSFVYCQKYKDLKVYAFVFMLNHLHCIVSAPDLGAVLRDMKKFLSKEIQRNILATEPNIFPLFEDKHGFSLWQKTNSPQLITSEKFFRQKAEYIHHNPVRKGYVHAPEDWKWSSASKIPTRITIEELPM